MGKRYQSVIELKMKTENQKKAVKDIVIQRNINLKKS